MTPEARAEHHASKIMLKRLSKKEHGKWEKAGNQGGHQKGWVEGRLKELQEQWAKGGQEKWVKANSIQAKSIREKARREEVWRGRKRS